MAPLSEREEQDIPELDFAANKTGPGASRRNFQEFPGGSGGAMQVCGAGLFVVAAVWVYRGSVVKGAYGICQEALELLRQ